MCRGDALYFIIYNEMIFFFWIEVSPVNVYTTMGSTLELTCRIQEDNSSYHLMFVFDNNEHNEVDQSNFIIRDKYEHDPVDQSHFSTRRKNPIILNKTIKSFDDEGNYICYKDDKKVGSAFVEIECKFTLLWCNSI